MKRLVKAFKILLGSVLVSLLAGCEPTGREQVVVYTSQDQQYAEPILREFTRESGIEVRAVYDSEAAKTIGLVNRLLAESAHPRCDLFWNNEELRMHQLASRNMFREHDPWRAFGQRSRRLVINTNLVAFETAPQSWSELTNAHWRGKVALAYPLFGTTATHFLALRQFWGEEKWNAWCRALQENRPLLVDGNSVVVKMVSRGEAWIGMTDSDDIAAAQREGMPVAGLPLCEESLLIPNTAGVIRGAPHPEAAQRLLEFLESERVVRQLIEVNALEPITAPARRMITPDWPALLHDLDATTTALKNFFLR